MRFTQLVILLSLLVFFALPALAADDVAAVMALADKGDAKAQRELCNLEPCKNCIGAGFIGYCEKLAESGDQQAKDKYFHWLMKGGVNNPDECWATGPESRIQLAQEGNISIQYLLGMNYYGSACHHAIEQNYGEAYFWLSLALMSGQKSYADDDTNYAFWRDDAAKHLSSEQKAALDKRVKAWKPTPAPLSAKQPGSIAPPAGK